MHPADLLGAVQVAAIERSGIDPAAVGQVVGGCVGQVGEQTFNIARTAWLTAGLPLEVAATTVDAQCGSSQQATNLAVALVKGGVVDIALSCGVEMMSRVPLGATIGEGPRATAAEVVLRRATRSPRSSRAPSASPTSGASPAPTATRSACSPRSAPRQAWAEGRFEREVLALDAPDLGEDGKPTGTTHHVGRDEGLRETSLEALAELKPVGRENGVHTAGSSSQISDGAAAVLLMTAARAQGARPDPAALASSTSASSASTRC